MKSAISRILILSIILGSAACGGDTSVWGLHGDSRHFVLSALGQVESTSGAQVKLIGRDVPTNEMASAVISVPAYSFRGKRAQLTAAVEADELSRGGGFWIRAESDHVLKLTRSDPAELQGTISEANFHASIVVPEEAQKIYIGMFSNGVGTISASHVRLLAQNIDQPSGFKDDKPAIEPLIVVNEALRIVKEHALHSSSIDWPALESKLRAEAGVASTAFDARDEVRELLLALNDGHSFLLPPKMARSLNSSGKTSAEPEVRLESEIFGYIKMPGYFGTEREQQAAFARSMRDRIRAIAPKATCGWILDLRENMGGNMWPMLAALQPFLGTESPGSFAMADGTTTPWHVEQLGASPDEPELDLNQIPVAVLLSGNTASSGEAVAIAFSGRSATRSFGSTTKGQTTSNRTFNLPDGSMIALATGIEADRTGKKYESGVVSNYSGAQGAVSALVDAEDWLKSQDRCTP